MLFEIDHKDLKTIVAIISRLQTEIFPQPLEPEELDLLMRLEKWTEEK